MDFARVQLCDTIDEAREAVWNLRQSDVDTVSLGEKLENMSIQVGREFDLPVTFSISGAANGVSHPIAHDLLMVAREAVCNAALHGRPEHVEVTLACNPRELILCVVDDGCGFEIRQIESQNGHHFGLKGMRERIERWGGKFRLTSAVGKDVRTEVHLPCRG